MKIKRLLASILFLTLILNPIFAFAQDGDSAIENGINIGYNDGYIFVLQTYSPNSQIPLSPSIPSSSTVYSKYNATLAGETTSYKANFYRGYVEGYLEGFTEGRALLITGQTPPANIELNYAESLGQSLGEIYGFRDYYNNSNSSWTRAIPTNNKIISLFELNRETSQYRSKFLAEFRAEFKIAYEEAFEFALLDVKDRILGSAVSDGMEIGTILGSIYGGKDYFDGRSNNYKRNLPSDSSIISDYLLNRTLVDYKTGFVNGFKLGYEEGYNEAYYNSFKEAVETGKKAGEAKGEMMATKDYIENKTMDWSKHKSSSSSISAEYHLVYLSNVYRDSFINSFWAGFAKKYEETYKSLMDEKLNEKIAYGILSIAGGTLSSPGNSISVEIQKGTFYNDIALSIEKIFNTRYRIDDARYIPSSDIYSIQLSNASNNLNNLSPVTISMEYYGKYDGGIYKWVDNRWNYINSYIEDGKIKAHINPNTLRSGDNIYCVLIDKQYNILTDIRSHWAKDELDTLIRRDIIKGYTDQTFKPERDISRAEFLALLSRVYHWNLPRSTENIQVFEDYESFHSMDKVISYGISAGYILGYEDNTFRPNQSISYKEIETIMGRILKDASFKWYHTSAKMLYEKQIKSNSYNNMNNKITRAEAIYMLYILNEWRY